MDHFRTYLATHVMVTLPDGKPTRHTSFHGPCAIVHDTEKFVWISASYSDELIDGMKQVGDGRDNGYSHDGMRIISIPAEWCRFIDGDEAETIERCMDADDRLLSYAR